MLHSDTRIFLQSQKDSFEFLLQLQLDLNSASSVVLIRCAGTFWGQNSQDGRVTWARVVQKYSDQISASGSNHILKNGLFRRKNMHSDIGCDRVIQSELRSGSSLQYCVQNFLKQDQETFDPKHPDCHHPIRGVDSGWISGTKHHKTGSVGQVIHVYHAHSFIFCA